MFKDSKIAVGHGPSTFDRLVEKKDKNIQILHHNFGLISEFQSAWLHSKASRYKSAPQYSTISDLHLYRMLPKIY
jgi:hypothetical protein